jgi:hypothetical protein
MLDYLKQFLCKFKSLPYFALTFLTRLTQDSLADTRKADAIYLKIFEDINRDATFQFSNRCLSYCTKPYSVVAEEKQNSLIQSGISINILFVLF